MLKLAGYFKECQHSFAFPCGILKDMFFFTSAFFRFLGISVGVDAKGIEEVVHNCVLPAS